MHKGKGMFVCFYLLLRVVKIHLKQKEIAAKDAEKI